MTLRTVATGFALAAAAWVAQAAPVLVLQTVGGVDLNNLVVGQMFQMEVIIRGDTPGEVDSGFTGSGSVSEGSPFLELTNSVFGTVKQGVDWSLDPSLYVLDFEAREAGSDVIFTEATCLDSNLQEYGCGFGSGPLSFTVRNRVPEPASLALVGLAVLGLGSVRRRT